MGRSHRKASSLLSPARGWVGLPHPVLALVLALGDAGSRTGRERVAEEGGSGECCRAGLPRNHPGTSPALWPRSGDSAAPGEGSLGMDLSLDVSCPPPPGQRLSLLTHTCCSGHWSVPHPTPTPTLLLFSPTRSCIPPHPPFHQLPARPLLCFSLALSLIQSTHLSGHVVICSGNSQLEGRSCLVLHVP